LPLEGGKVRDRWPGKGQKVTLLLRLRLGPSLWGTIFES
jgi:hypothetical protein